MSFSSKGAHHTHTPALFLPPSFLPSLCFPLPLPLFAFILPKGSTNSTDQTFFKKREGQAYVILRKKVNKKASLVICKYLILHPHSIYQPFSERKCSSYMLPGDLEWSKMFVFSFILRIFQCAFHSGIRQTRLRHCCSPILRFSLHGSDHSLLYKTVAFQAKPSPETLHVTCSF